MNRRSLFHKIVTIIGVALVNAAACAGPEVAPPGIENLTQQLTSEDAKVAEEARAKLEGMGAEVVPALFEKLPAADWTLRPRLLEVLSANGREFAKKKLLEGNNTERIYAALVYELTRPIEADDFGTPEFKAMVEALLRAIKSEDKYLRATAAVALVQDDKRNAWFDHFHELVPALISSFDTELMIDRGHQPGPWDVPFVAICVALDGLIGDRLAYYELKATIDVNMRRVLPEGARSQRDRVLALVAARDEIEELRTYWLEWWNQHSKMSAAEVGTLIIDRNLRILGTSSDDRSSSGPKWTAQWSLEYWTGADKGSFDEWKAWWTIHRRAYIGPKSDG